MNNNTSKRVNKVSTLKQVNIDTGEVNYLASVETSRIESEPSFIKIFIDDLSRLTHLPKGCPSVLSELLKYMTYENLIILNPYIKTEIAKNTNLTENRVTHLIADLIENGILTRIASSTYFANPDLFGRGKWADIRELRLTIKYDKDGRTFHVERNRPKQLSIDEFGKTVEDLLE